MSASTLRSDQTRHPTVSPHELLAECFRDGYRPDPWLTVSEWADESRILSGRSSAESGRWRTGRTPYLREIMDTLSARSPVQRVVFMKGAQIGGTEAGNNWLGYVIDQAPGPMLAVQPTVEMAKRWSKQRVADLIEHTPALREKVKDARSRDSGNTLQSKEFPGGVVVLTGANSAVGLRSMPARYVFLDEVDGYPGDVDGEGDPVALAETRTRNFPRKKIFLVSTPTIEGRSRIKREYMHSDQRRFFVPCPECNHYQSLKFEQLRWEKGQPRDAVYVCEGCGSALGEHHKTWMLENGKWRPTAEGDGETVGYHLSALYSPVGWMSWVEIAQRWEAAQGDPDLLKEFVNTVLGETWAERGEAPDWQRLYDRREHWKAGTVPAGGALLTAGADVQPDRIEVSVWAWGRGRESWLIEHRVLTGDTSRSEVWGDLTDLLNDTWRHAEGGEVALERLAIDTNYAQTEVLTWVRNAGDRRVMPIRGMDRTSTVLGQPTAVDISAGGRKMRRGVKVWTVGVSVLKLETYRWLRLNRPTEESGEPYPPGFIHLPDHVGEEFCKQLTAEELVARTRKGYRRDEWQKTRERNEALDCRVYARAAAIAAGIDRFKERDWCRRGGKIEKEPARPARSHRGGNGPSGQSSKTSNREPAITPRPATVIDDPYL